MNALDTNILVRYFVDNPFDEEDVRQHTIAKKVIKERCYVSLTVILEMAWVLKSRYKLSHSDIAQAVMLLCRASNIRIENQHLLVEATGLYANGMDFADALHWVQASHCERLYTFDQRFIKKSEKATNSFIPVIEPNLTP